MNTLHNQFDLSGNMLIKGQDDELNNPNEMDNEDEEDQDDDPETLEEFDRRQEEIIEQFMEMSLSRKHDERERVTTELQDNGQEDLIPQRLKEVNKLMDQKRKDGLKVLKRRL